MPDIVPFSTTISVTVGLQVNNTVQTSFDILLKNPCVDENYVRQSIPNTMTVSYTVSGSATAYLMPNINLFTVEPTFCGAIDLRPSVVFNPNILEFDAAGNLIDG